jgi:hypothetical protein
MYNATSFESARVVTVSGSGSSATVTMGSAISFNESGNNNCQAPVLQFMRNTSDKVIFAYHDNYHGSGEGRVLTISGTGGSASLSTSGKTRFNTSRPFNMKSTYDITNNVMVVNLVLLVLGMVAILQGYLLLIEQMAIKDFFYTMMLKLLIDGN